MGGYEVKQFIFEHNPVCFNCPRAGFVTNQERGGELVHSVPGRLVVYSVEIKNWSREFLGYLSSEFYLCQNHFVLRNPCNRN